MVRISLFSAAQALPVFEPDKDKTQLLADFGLRLQVIGQRFAGRIDDIGQGGKHTFDHEVGDHGQASMIQMPQLGFGAQVGGQVQRDVLAQRANGLANRL